MELPNRRAVISLMRPPRVLTPTTFARRAAAAVLSLEAEGRLSGPFGRVGAEVSVEEGRELARLAGVSIQIQDSVDDVRRTMYWYLVVSHDLSSQGVKTGRSSIHR